jgi:predicted Zn-dependent peptidase
LPWQGAERVPERLQQITPAQIQDVARRYLRKEYSTLAVLDPQPLPDDASDHSAPAPGVHHAR